MSVDHGELAALGDLPVPLYELFDLAPRTLSTNFDGERLTLVKVAHGTREHPQLPWVEVIIHGPLHGTSTNALFGSNATWEELPDTLPLFHVVVSNDPQIDGTAIPAAEAQLAQDWTTVELAVDGVPRTFELVRQGAHWGALRRIEPDHAIAICASNIEPEAVRLERIRDLGPYLAQH